MCRVHSTLNLRSLYIQLIQLRYIPTSDCKITISNCFILALSTRLLNFKVHCYYRACLSLIYF